MRSLGLGLGLLLRVCGLWSVCVRCCDLCLSGGFSKRAGFVVCGCGLGLVACSHAGGVDQAEEPRYHWTPVSDAGQGLGGRL